MMSYFIELSVLLFVYLSSMVVVACYKEDTSIANFTWGGGVLLVTLYTFFRMSNFLLQQIIATICIALWASRLIMYVYTRYTGKDPRFTTWKWQGLKALIINTIWVFGQLLMIAIMSYAVVLINIYNMPHALSLLDVVGIIIWIGGYCIEMISDNQLFAFLHNPANKGKVMDSGLWRYSRHPNYFGESTMWVGIYILALSIPYGWTAFITPLTITFLLRFVTGVPLLENAMKDNAAYQEYKRKTNTFIPWFAKK
jgi:steroid 5-alpha reductase family enzyme